MDDERKKDREEDESQDEVLSRRSFLTSLGKWSSIVVAAAAIGFSEAAGSDRPKEEFDEAAQPRSGRESLPGGTDTESDDMHPQWWRRCRVWGNRGCRVWGNRGCRVWGNRW